VQATTDAAAVATAERDSDQGGAPEEGNEDGGGMAEGEAATAAGSEELLAARQAQILAKKSSPEGTKNDLQGVQWGKLISPYAQNPSCIPLIGRQFIIGRSRQCNWQIPATIHSGSVFCKLTVDMDSSGKAVVFLTALTDRGALSVNGHVLKKNDKTKLLGGYEINIGAIPAKAGSKHSFAFIFQPCPVPASKLPPRPAAPQAAGSPGAQPEEETTAEAVPSLSMVSMNAEAVGEATKAGAPGTSKPPTDTEMADAELSLKQAMAQLAKMPKVVVEPTVEAVKEAPLEASPASGDTALPEAGGSGKAEEEPKPQETKPPAEQVTPPSFRQPHPQLEHFRGHFRQTIKAADALEVSFDSLGYHLGEGAKQRLLHTAFLHLQQPDLKPLAKVTAELASASARVLLSSSHGTDLCQEAVVQALARHCGARLLVYDRLALQLNDPPARSAAAAATAGEAASGSEGAFRKLLLKAATSSDPMDDPVDMPRIGDLMGLPAPMSPGSDRMSPGPDGVGLDTAPKDKDPKAEDPEAEEAVVPKEAAVGEESRLEDRRKADDAAAWNAAESAADAAEAAASTPPQSRGKMTAAKALSSLQPITLGSVMAGRPGLSVSNNPRSAGIGRPLKKGDRVRFIGHASAPASAVSTASGMPVPSSLFGIGGLRSSSAHGKAAAAASSSHRGPFYNCPGQVVLAFDTTPGKVGVRFDYAVSGGTSLGNLCEGSMGYWCNVSDLRLEGSGKAEEREGAAIDALFDVAEEEAAKGPVIIYLKDVEKSVMGHVERFLHFKRRAEKAKGRLLLVGQHISDAKKERTWGGIFARMGAAGPGGSPASALLDLSFLDPLRAEERNPSRTEQPKMMKMLGKLMPNRIVLYPPTGEPEAAQWKKAIERDIVSMQGAANQRAVRQLAARCDVEIPEEEMNNVEMSEQALSPEAVEKLLGFAVSSQLMSSADAGAAGAELKDSKLVVRGGALGKAVALLKTAQEEAAPGKAAGDPKQSVSLKDVQTDNEFEKRVLGEVIPAEEVGVSFDNIGALDAVKNTLREVVMLPLQRPELFARGSLTKPTRGVLLFGPPGTGKTMLAKAVASESGANFINVSMSTLASKWFGEGEKYVRALFTLAHKIAPSVVFVDEVDSMLGRRDKTGEHEAMRKIKNEFMSNWDGLKTSECDRVLVLAATNRPFDLDEAVIRRLPRRLLVDLPDVSNRVTILRVILKDEELEPEFDFEALAALTEGYTGSDLRNLCIAAAYRPIRDFLEAEKKEKEEAARKGEEAEAEASPAAGEEAVTANKRPGELAKEGGPEAKESGPEGKAEAAPVQLRPLTLDDLVASMDQICPSNSSEAASMTELRQWNDLYGEGGSRKKDTLTYFM